MQRQVGYSLLVVGLAAACLYLLRDVLLPSWPARLWRTCSTQWPIGSSASAWAG
jgi:hypothetical protein